MKVCRDDMSNYSTSPAVIGSISGIEYNTRFLLLMLDYHTSLKWCGA